MEMNQPRQRAPLATLNFSTPFSRDQPIPRSFPSTTMNPAEMVKRPDSSGMGMWSSPPAPASRPRPLTIHETGFTFCIPDDFAALATWEPLELPVEPSDGYTQNFSLPQPFYASPSEDIHDWNLPKPCDETMELDGLESNIPIGQALTTDEVVPVLDLGCHTATSDHETMPMDSSYQARRMSGSSFTLSTAGGLSDMNSFDEFSTAYSDAPSYASDYLPTRSNRNSLLSSTQLSPVASPRIAPQARSELVRTHSRGRASPSPRPNVRSAPYSLDASRSKRWSTGSYAPRRRPSPFVYHAHDTFSPYARGPSQHSSPTIPSTHTPLNMTNLQMQQQPFFMAQNASYSRNSMFVPSHNMLESQPQYLSHGLFRMLQSNADPYSLHSQFTDLSDPPDLFASLHEEQIPPPDEDMNPSDPDMVPHEQELRFDGDLYTPRWVRGHGNKREGWCGICKPGRWLVLKNSAFWYDKSFTHGISAATGCPFQEPQETRRMDGNPDVWEGLCSSCNEWVALVSSKKKGTTWFRHAYKCHTHPKAKDATKRRRESGNGKTVLPAATTKPKEEAKSPQITQTSQASQASSSPASTNRLPKPPSRNLIDDLSNMI